MMYRWIAMLVVVGTLAGHPIQARGALVIQAENAAIRTEGGRNLGGGWNLWSNGCVGQAVRLAAAGRYRIIVRAWGSPAGGVWPEMALLIDGQAVKTVSVGSAQRADYRFDVELAAGIHEVAAAYLNDAVIEKEDRNLYLDRFTNRVCFAHPAMKAITWWDLSDQGSWLPGGGMLRSDMSPKPVYEQLKRLVHEEWKTKLSTTTNSDGRISFRGFCGDYRLVVETPKGKVEKALHLTRNSPAETVLAVP